MSEKISIAPGRRLYEAPGVSVETRLLCSRFLIIFAEYICLHYAEKTFQENFSGQDVNEHEIDIFSRCNSCDTSAVEYYLDYGVANESDTYNLQLLAIVGEHDPSVIPKMDFSSFIREYGDLKSTLDSKEAIARADSVIYAYSAYMLTSLEFEKVIVNDFIDNRDWYFKRLQPKYQRLRTDIEKLNDVIYMDLKENSQTFQDGFYRSIIPGVVSVGAGLLLVLLLLIFILIYYIRPLKKMLSGIHEYQTAGRKYCYDFEGDDELVHLNGDLSELIEENIELKKRLNRLREERERLIESSAAAKEL